MRILHLITNLGRGGAETQLSRLAAGLSRRQHDVAVVYLGDGVEDRLNLGILADADVSVTRLNVRGAYDPLTLPRLVRLIRALRPEVVQTWIPMMDIVGGFAALLAGRPWILSERSAPKAFAGRRKVRVRALLARRASAIVSNSGNGNDYWAEQVGERVLRAIIPNALPLERIDATPPADDESFLRGRDLVLYAGRLNADKNIAALLESMEDVVRRREETAALICGVGPLEGEICDFIRSRGLEDRIRATGFVSNPWPWMKRAAVFVSPSRYEGMPNAVMEAMACGCPVVLSAIPAHLEIADEQSALFVNGADAAELAGALVRALDERTSSESLARHAQERAMRWSIEAVVDLYEALYARVTAGGTGQIAPGDRDDEREASRSPSVAAVDASSR